MVDANKRIAVIGLGYVGLPLAVEFSKKYNVTGFDINAKRINELQKGIDVTHEIKASELSNAKELKFTSDEESLRESTIFIVTVPTPVDSSKRPDLRPLLNASELVGRVLKFGDIVIFESTVYPGATEEDCVPVLEKASGLTFNKDFYCGYSPERINPGDHGHRLIDIVKVTSGSTPAIAEAIDQLYSSIIDAGTHKAESIRVAEAAKVIENTQRDLNIALINELAIIFGKMDLDTEAVLQASGTKWNFLPFRPGLVGGHCIGVDPYYLTHKAQSLGHNPDIILAGRRVNDAMGSHIVSQFVKAMTERNIKIGTARILIMGFTFKENCPDTRNTRVIDIVKELLDYNCDVEVYDPWIQSDVTTNKYPIKIIDEPELDAYDGIILAVPHDEFKDLGAVEIRNFGKKIHVFYDVKSLFKRNDSDIRL
jgi:UDP-N-acetyl-D-galactosamine dehydrogenase